MKRTSFTAAIGVLVCFLVTISLSGQQTSSTSSQSSLYLQQSYSQLVGNASLADITLSGSVRRIVGSDDQSGSATLKALPAGAASADFSLSSGTISEIHNFSSTELTGAWSSTDAKIRTIPLHNLLSEPAWFFPTFAISRRLAAEYVVTDLGPIDYDGQQVEHISTSQKSPLQLSASRIPFQHLSEVDFYIDSGTLLPVAISFNTHPDDNALLDIPVEIRFSDYRLVSGAKVPFHIEKFVNGSLLLDIQIQNATINVGVSVPSITSL
jgi:hypothetical protein